MKAFFLIIFIILVSFLEIKKLYAKKKKREIYVFSVLILLATYLSLGTLLDIYIPNPTNGLKIIFEPIQTWLFKILS